MSARPSVEELEALFGVSIDTEDVETVGGLLAHQLGKAPTATVSGLRLNAENLTGRWNRIGTVLVRRRDIAGEGTGRAELAGKLGERHAIASNAGDGARNGVASRRQVSD